MWIPQNKEEDKLALIIHPATFLRLIKYVLVLNVPGLNPSGGHSSCDPFVYCVPLLSIGRIYLFSYLGVDLSLPLFCLTIVSSWV